MARRRGKWFPHLHIHDEHSIKDGCATVETYGDKVVELGGTSLAITNHGMAAGFARQYFACEERGIKPIFGMEAYVNEHRLKPVREAVAELRKRAKKDPSKKDKLSRAEGFLKGSFRPSRHMIVLAKTHAGYRNLVKMSSDSWLNGFYYAPRTSTQYLIEHREGLVLSTACIGGYIPVMARTDFWAAVKEARRLQSHFGADFYVEIMMTEYPPQQETNEVMLRLAHEIGAECIVTCDVHYARPMDSLAQDTLLLMRDKKTIADATAGEGVWQFETKDLYWRTLEDVYACWQEFHSHYLPREDLVRAIKNTYALADSIEDIKFDCSLKLPGIYEKPENTLRELVKAGIRDRFAGSHCPAVGKKPRDYIDRVKRELGVIERQGFAEYFLILWDICKYARESGARIGPGRGSAGGSLCAFLLRITDIDPLRFDLLFERFLDESRSDPPDIDLDFSPEHRDGIKRYIEGRYPATATIGSYGTFKPRATLKDVGRVYGVDYRETERATKPMGMDGDKLSWEEIFDLWPSVRKWTQDHPEAFEVVRVLKGLISYRGKNAAGMLIAPESALDEIPMVFDPGDKSPCTAFPDSQGDGVKHKGRELTRLGCLKVDILGVRNLNIAARAIEIASRGRDGPPVPMDPSELDLADPDALGLAGGGDVPGVFQLDSNTTRPILRRVGVDSFMDLVMVTALCRPGPLKHKVDRTFARLKRSGDSWKEGVPEKLVARLSDSRGLMILQEDVMHVSRAIAGFTGPESNELRRIISKKLPEKMKLYEAKFIKGGSDLGREVQEMQGIWDKIATFAGYGFCKAHSVSYMLTAYHQLVMLAHHPREYFTALMCETPRAKKSSRGDEKLVQFMRSAMARGIPVLPPSALAPETNFELLENGIRFGLEKIKGVASAAEFVLEAQPFWTLEELHSRVNKTKVNVAKVAAMIYAGALDDLPFEGEELAEEGVLRRNDLLARWYELRKNKKEPDRFSELVLLSKERELIGVALSWWASDVKDRLREMEGLSTIAECVEDDRSKLEVLAEITRARTHNSRRGTMAFLALADETGSVENVIIWAEQWKHYKNQLRMGGMVAIRLRRRENENRQYGKWSYYLEDRGRAVPVRSVQRMMREMETVSEALDPQETE